MRLFFDINEKRLVPALGSTAAVRSISFVRGDDTDLEVGFIRDNALVELEGAFSIVFVIKVTPGPDVVTQAIADVWTLEGDYYRASLDLTGTTLDALVGTKKTINLLCELTYTDENGGPNTSQLVTAVVGGDLYRGDELPPDAPGVPESWLQAQLSGAPSKNPPVDADTMPLSDSAAGGALRKITFANLRTALNAFHSLKSKFYFIGDSILTENGLGSSYVANLLTSHNAVFFGSAYEDRAVVGRTYAEVLAALDSDLANLDAAKETPIVVVGTGVNPLAAGVSAATVLLQLTAICDDVHERGGKVVAYNCPDLAAYPVGDLYRNAVLDFNYGPGGFADLVENGTIDVGVDIYQLAYDAGDILHPSPLGSRQIFRELSRMLAGEPMPAYPIARLPARTAGTITNISVAAQAILTEVGHGFSDGQIVHFTGTDSTPPIDGVHAVTVLTANTYSVPVTTTVAGTTGTSNKGVVKVVTANVRYRTPESWLIYSCHINGGGASEVFIGSSLYSADPKYGFDLRSVGYQPFNAAPTASPSIFGVAMFRGQFVGSDCYVVNTDYAWPLIIQTQKISGGVYAPRFL